jgi:hypothetical protein
MIAFARAVRHEKSKGHSVPGLLAPGFRLMLGSELLLKSGRTPAIRRDEAILVTEVQVIG